MEATKLTGLWKNQDKNGNDYLSGSLNSISQIMVFPNSFKKDDDAKAPDFFLYVAAREKSESKPKTTDEL